MNRLSDRVRHERRQFGGDRAAGPQALVVNLVALRAVELCASIAVLAEYREVFSRPKFARLDSRQVSRLIALIESANTAPHVHDSKVNSRDLLKYMWIPPGTFKMGCSPGDGECYNWEQSAHEVTI